MTNQTLLNQIELFTSFDFRVIVGIEIQRGKMIIIPFLYINNNVIMNKQKKIPKHLRSVWDLIKDCMYSYLQY